jgi:glycolate oxidase FAD binding subunit
MSYDDLMEAEEDMGMVGLELEQIVGLEGIRTWENLDPVMRQRLTEAIAPGCQPDYLLYPPTQEALGQIMTLAGTHRQRVLPTGHSSKLHWGGLVRDPNWIISTKYLDHIVEHAVGDFTLTVEAGMKLADIQATLAKTGQFLAIDPTYAQTATIGGIVATGDTGSWRQRYNSVRDQLIGISFCRYDGQIVKAGGRVVKNVAGYDLMKLLTGSFGTLGMITQLTFRLYPLPEASQTVVLTGEAGAIASAVQTLLSSSLTPVAADLLSTQLVANLDIGTGLGLMVQFQSLPQSVAEQSRRVLEWGEKLGLSGGSYGEEDEVELWRRSRNLMESPFSTPRILGKMGVKSTAAVMAFTQLDAMFPQQAMGLIHVGSGLGKVAIATERLGTATSKWRSICQSHNGFLTVLEAPISVKQQIDIWGYNGKAIGIMKQLKHKFDSENVLSPGRFIV